MKLTYPAWIYHRSKGARVVESREQFEALEDRKEWSDSPAFNSDPETDQKPEDSKPEENDPVVDQPASEPQPAPVEEPKVEQPQPAEPQAESYREHMEQWKAKEEGEKQATEKKPRKPRKSKKQAE